MRTPAKHAWESNTDLTFSFCRLTHTASRQKDSSTVANHARITTEWEQPRKIYFTKELLLEQPKSHPEKRNNTEAQSQFHPPLETERFRH